MNQQRHSLKIVVLVSGRGSNLKAIINAQKQGLIASQIIKVISNKSDALALQHAKDANIETEVILSKGLTNSEFQKKLKQTLVHLNPDLVVLAGFMRILSEDIVSTFEHRIINIHPSLLPAFPGLHSVRQALDAGVKVTGCTVHFVDQGCDTGPVILQTPIQILDQDTEDTLASRLLQKEHETLVKSIKLLEENKVILQGRKTLLREDT